MQIVWPQASWVLHHMATNLIYPWPHATASSWYTLPHKVKPLVRFPWRRCSVSRQHDCGLLLHSSWLVPDYLQPCMHNWQVGRSRRSIALQTPNSWKKFLYFLSPFSVTASLPREWRLKKLCTTKHEAWVICLLYTTWATKSPQIALNWTTDQTATSSVSQ